LGFVHRRAPTLRTDDPGPGHRCQSDDENEKYENELALIMSAAVVMVV